MSDALFVLDRPLILASTSPYRKALLERWGIPFTPYAPSFDEASVPWTGDAATHAASLARGKALSVVDAPVDALVLASDQVVHCNGVVYGKPGTEERAVQQLLALSGTTHDLVTAVALWDRAADRWHERSVAYRMTIRAWPEAFLRAYVQRDRPFDCAGSYRIEAAGTTLFGRIEGADPTSIEGLPGTAVVELLLPYVRW